MRKQKQRTLALDPKQVELINRFIECGIQALDAEELEELMRISLTFRFFLNTVREEEERK